MTGLKELESFVIKGCSFDIVDPNGFSGIEGIMQFTLSDSHFGRVGKHAFGDISNVLDWRFLSCHFASINDEAFYGLIKVHSIQFYQCNITFIGQDIFGGADEIEYVNFYMNTIYTLSNGSLTSIKESAEMLVVYANKFQCNCENAWLISMPEFEEYMSGNECFFWGESADNLFRLSDVTQNVLCPVTIKHRLRPTTTTQASEELPYVHEEVEIWSDHGGIHPVHQTVEEHVYSGNVSVNDSLHETSPQMNWTIEFTPHSLEEIFDSSEISDLDRNNNTDSSDAKEDTTISSPFVDFFSLPTVDYHEDYNEDGKSNLLNEEQLTVTDLSDSKDSTTLHSDASSSMSDASTYPTIQLSNTSQLRYASETSDISQNYDLFETSTNYKTTIDTNSSDLPDTSSFHQTTEISDPIVNSQTPAISEPSDISNFSDYSIFPETTIISQTADSSVFSAPTSSSSSLDSNSAWNSNFNSENVMDDDSTLYEHVPGVISTISNTSTFDSVDTVPTKTDSKQFEKFSSSLDHESMISDSSDFYVSHGFFSSAHELDVEYQAGSKLSPASQKLETPTPRSTSSSSSFLHSSPSVYDEDDDDITSPDMYPDTPDAQNPPEVYEHRETADNDIDRYVTFGSTSQVSSSTKVPDIVPRRQTTSAPSTTESSPPSTTETSRLPTTERTTSASILITTSVKSIRLDNNSPRPSVEILASSNIIEDRTIEGKSNEDNGDDDAMSEKNRESENSLLHILTSKTASVSEEPTPTFPVKERYDVNIGIPEKGEKSPSSERAEPRYEKAQRDGKHIYARPYSTSAYGRHSEHGGNAANSIVSIGALYVFTFITSSLIMKYMIVK